MTRDGRGNDSHVPRCIRCGHPIEVHYRATRRDPRSGCNGTLEPCGCPAYADTEADLALTATALATRIAQIRDFIALHAKARGRSDVNANKVIGLLDDALAINQAHVEAAETRLLERSLVAIDNVRLRGYAMGTDWADGFRQGHRAAREAVARLAASDATTDSGEPVLSFFCTARGNGLSDWCSQHGDIDQHRSIVYHLQMAHDMSYDEYRTLKRIDARRQGITDDEQEERHRRAGLAASDATTETDR